MYLIIVSSYHTSTKRKLAHISLFTGLTRDAVIYYVDYRSASEQHFLCSNTRKTTEGGTITEET